MRWHRLLWLYNRIILIQANELRADPSRLILFLQKENVWNVNGTVIDGIVPLLEQIRELAQDQLQDLKYHPLAGDGLP